MKCPQCGSQIKGAPEICPVCRFPLSARSRRARRILSIVIPVVIVAAVIGVPGYLLTRGSSGLTGSTSGVALTPATIGPVTTAPATTGTTFAGSEPLDTPLLPPTEETPSTEAPPTTAVSVPADAIAIILEAQPAAGRQVSRADLDTCARILLARLEANGIQAYRAVHDGASLITVSVPKGTDVEQVASLAVGGKLEFLDVNDFGIAFKTEAEALQAVGISVAADAPVGTEIVYWPTDADNESGEDEWYAAKPGLKVDGSMLENVSMGYSSDGPELGLIFTDYGRDVFAALTRTMAERGEASGEVQVLAIVLDGKVRSAANVRSEIPSGEASITGDFTVEEVNRLVVEFESGIMPVPLAPKAAGV